MRILKKKKNVLSKSSEKVLEKKRQKVTKNREEELYMLFPVSDIHN